MSEFGYRCEHCEGTVHPKRVKQEAFKHKLRFVILEDVTIGVCDSCGSRYYSAESFKAFRNWQPVPSHRNASTRFPSPTRASWQLPAACPAVP